MNNINDFRDIRLIHKKCLEENHIAVIKMEVFYYLSETFGNDNI